MLSLQCGAWLLLQPHWPAQALARLLWQDAWAWMQPRYLADFASAPSGSGMHCSATDNEVSSTAHAHSYKTKCQPAQHYLDTYCLDTYCRYNRSYASFCPVSKHKGCLHSRWAACDAGHQTHTAQTAP